MKEDSMKNDLDSRQKDMVAKNNQLLSRLNYTELKTSLYYHKSARRTLEQYVPLTSHCINRLYETKKTEPTGAGFLLWAKRPASRAEMKTLILTLVRM